MVCAVHGALSRLEPSASARRSPWLIPRGRSSFVASLIIRHLRRRQRVAQASVSSNRPAAQAPRHDACPRSTPGHRWDMQLRLRVGIHSQRDELLYPSCCVRVSRRARPGTRKPLPAATNYWLDAVRPALPARLSGLRRSSAVIRVSARQMMNFYGDRACTHTARATPQKSLCHRVERREIKWRRLSQPRCGVSAVKGVTTLKPGDTIMASPGARGEVVYEVSCRVPVEPGALHVVAAKSPCSRQAEWSPPSKLGGCSLKGDSSGCRIEPEPDRHHLLIGAAVIGAGVGAIILLQDDNPSSP